MKFTIETNYLKPFLSRNKRTISLFTLYAVLIALFIGAALVQETVQPILRDFYIANMAEFRAGPKIPFTEEDMGYQRGFKIDENNTYSFGIESNSIWMADYLRIIVPYFGYEKVTPTPFYPKSAGLLPFMGNTSFHVAGRMFPGQDVILLNERYLLDDRWNDQRRALTTLVM